MATRVFYKVAGKQIAGLNEDAQTAIDTATTFDDLIFVETTKDIGKASDTDKDKIDAGGNVTNGDELRITSDAKGSYVLHEDIVNVETVAISENYSSSNTTTGGGGDGDTAIDVDASKVLTALTIIGNDGINNIIATVNNDTIAGANGNDIITGGAGADSMNGDNGDDLFVLNTLAEYASGENINGGGDTVTTPYATGGDILVINDTVAGTLTIQGASTTNAFRTMEGITVGTVDKKGKISTSGNLAINIDASFAGSTTGARGSLDLTLTGNNGDNILTGNDGDTLFYGNGGKDTLTGGTGNDVFAYIATKDIVAGEQAIGATGTNWVSLEGSGTFVFSEDAMLQGIPSIQMSSTGKLEKAAIGVDLTGQTEAKWDITGQAGSNTITTGTGAYVMASGLAGADKITTTGTGNDYIDGGDDNDVIVSGDGTYLDTSGNSRGITDGDEIYGGKGNDTITSGTGYDYIEGNDGDDKITSGSGNDTIDGGRGKDTIVAGDGDDTIYGGKGSDTIDGGKGADLIYLSKSTEGGTASGKGDDKVTGGEGSDTFVIDHVSWSKKISIDGEGGKDLTSGYDATGDTDTVIFTESLDQASTISGVLKIDPKAIKGIERFIIDSNAGNNSPTMSVDGSKDLGIDASKYTTKITMIGNGGANILKSGAADDTLTGNAGADKFVFANLAATAASADTITDFTVAQSDKLIFSDKVFNLGVDEGKGGTAFNAFTAFTGAILETNGDTFTSADARFGFNTTTGALYYDADGSGTGSAAVQIATLTGVTSLTATDLQFTA